MATRPAGRAGRVDGGGDGRGTGGPAGDGVPLAAEMGGSVPGSRVGVADETLPPAPAAQSGSALAGGPDLSYSVLPLPLLARGTRRLCQNRVLSGQAAAVRPTCAWTSSSATVFVRSVRMCRMRSRRPWLSEGTSGPGPGASVTQWAEPLNRGPGGVDVAGQVGQRVPCESAPRERMIGGYG